MQFFQLKNPDTGAVSEDRVDMIDDAGFFSTLMPGNWLWDIYQQWLASGNTPLPPA